MTSLTFSTMPLPVVDPQHEHLSWTDTVTKEFLKKQTKMNIKRQEMIYELIQTEKGFYRHLLIMKFFFRDCLAASQVLTEVELTVMFSNLEEIITVSEALGTALTRLQQQCTGRDVDVLGDIVYPVLKNRASNIYARFCADYKTSADFYHTKMATSLPFAHVLKTIEQRPEVLR